MAGRKPLFVTGVARGGTTLLARILATADGVALPSDPYFPLFRALRTALVRAGGIAADRDLPLQDYYFTDERVAMLDAVQAGDLGVAATADEGTTVRAAVRERARFEAPELSSLVHQLDGETYRELFDSALAVAAEAYDGSVYTGSKEVWTIEFAAPLARAYRDARFVVLLRDPRGVLASLLALAAADATQAAHPLSYARHWRKTVAFAEHYRSHPLVGPRLHVLRYEDLVRRPEQELESLCRFLGLPLDARMLAPTWAGNSSFDAPLSGIDADSAGRWRTALEPAVLAMVELVCGPEMELAGYEPNAERGADPAILAHLVDSDAWPVSWRSDLGDPQLDYEHELARRAQLLQGCDDVAAIRRSFLFEEVYAALRPVAEERWTERASSR